MLPSVLVPSSKLDSGQPESTFFATAVSPVSLVAPLYTSISCKLNFGNISPIPSTPDIVDVDMRMNRGLNASIFSERSLTEVAVLAKLLTNTCTEAQVVLTGATIFLNVVDMVTDPLIIRSMY